MMKLVRGMAGCFAVFFLLAGTTSAQAQSERSVEPDVGIRFNPPSRVALTNAVVVDSRGTIDGCTVLVYQGRIEEVGPDVEIPTGTEIVDCRGDYLYPAFIDAFVEFESKDLISDGEHWNPNVTPHRRMAESLQLDSEQLKTLREAGIGIALAAPDDGIFKGQSCVITTADGGLSRNMLRPNGFQHLKLYPARRSRDYPNSPMGAMALVRQTLSDASWYQAAVQAADAQPQLGGPDYNSALASLGPVIQGKQSVVIDGPNELYEFRADQIAREFSLRAIIRGSGREYRRLDAIAALGRTWILPLDFPNAPELETEQQVADATLQELMHWELAPSNPARLDEAGVEYVLSSDGLDDVKEFLKKLRKAVDAGLTKQAALRAVTSAPAELLGVDDDAGTLERGKLANLLRTDGDLFDSKIAIKETWVRGQRFELKADQENELSGIWQLQLDPSDPPTLQLKVTGSLDKTAVAIGRPNAFESVEDSKPKQDRADEETGVSEGAESEPVDPDDDLGNRDAEKPDDSVATSAKLDNIEHGSYGLTGSFAAAAVWEKESGTAFLTVTKLKSESLKLNGSIVWPSGRRTTFIAERMSDATEAASSSQNELKSAEGEDGSRGTGDKRTEEAESEQEVQVEINYPLGAYGVKGQPDQPEWLLFRDATIWTCADEGILQSADLLIHRGTIHSVGIDLEAPEGAEVIDASGMHISPGIIDCHSHMATDGGVNESGQAVTAEVRISDFIDPNDITIYRQLAGGVTSSNILHGSANPIGGQNQVIKLRWGALAEEMKMAEAPSGIKFALGENVKQSRLPDGTRYPRTRMGVEQILRDRFEAAKRYRASWDAWMNAAKGLPPRRDYELEAIAEILEGKRWIHCHSYRQDEILATIRVLDDYGVTIGSFQHILEGYKVADAMAKHGATGSSFSDWWAYKFEVYDAIPHNGALMHRAGVVVSFNSDDRELARHLNHEAAKAVKYGGVSEQEALKFVTLNPAKQLRIDSWVGSLEPGKHADLVLWNRSPLSTLSACMQTWIDGRKYFDRNEDQRRREADEALRLKLIQKVLDGGAKMSKPRDDDPSYWWARYDEFCHHFDHDHHDGAEDHEEHRE